MKFDVAMNKRQCDKVVAMTFATAAVIGKFYPPHHGHRFVVRTALAQSAKVSVIICERPTDTIPGAVRAQWFREMTPEATVLVIDDHDDENDTEVWAANTIRCLGNSPEAVFTSETYGDKFARALGCVHVEVDRSRTKVPCSGTAVRNDPYAYWQFITPPVRAWFAKRVCVIGAESTGTTTLARALAHHYKTAWVEEYGREYSKVKQQRGETVWTTEEFVHIAAEQTAREDLAARQANRLLICDTNAFATVIWHRRYTGADGSAVQRIASDTRCDLYLLTGDEIPFVQDGLRDGEHIRHEMHGWFEEALGAQKVPWLTIRGTEEQRLAAAVHAIDALFSSSRWTPP